MLKPEYRKLANGEIYLVPSRAELDAARRAAIDAELRRKATSRGA